MSTAPPPTARPTISIYQNPDHVSGILQQLHYTPLLTSETHESGHEQTQADTRTREAGGGLSGSLSLPLVGAIDADITGQRSRGHDTGNASNSKMTRNYEYSQAYYLLHIRAELRKRGQLTAITSGTDARGLAAGDFVEFEASFRANEINALLDIMTPDLIGAITYHHHRTDGLNKFQAFNDFEALKRFAEQNIAQAQVNADLARSVAEAVRVDFRSAKTREFYGTVGDTDTDTVTAITICDAPHFVVDDEDRILDGRFTVLGKVTSPVTSDRPILERNKVLDRLKPEGIDDLFQQLRNSVSVQAQGMNRTGTPLPDDFVDMALASRIDGPSFNVIPIAIYA